MRRIWTQEFEIRTNELSTDGLLKPESLLAYLQEAAANHADDLDVGYSQFSKIDITWVLARLYFKIDKRPHWKDKLIIDTFPTGVKSLFATRDFVIKDGGGERIGVAHSYWAIINLKTRMPQRRLSSIEHLELVTDYLPPRDLPKLLPVDTPSYTKSITPRISDIDVNRHISNIAYLTYFIETLPYEFISRHSVSEAEINFLAEGFYGDEIDCLACDNGEVGFSHTVKRKSDGAVLANARTAWM